MEVLIRVQAHPECSLPRRQGRLQLWAGAVGVALVMGLVCAPIVAQAPVPSGPSGTPSAGTSGHITVYGEVGRPGKYHPVAGEMVSGVILRAGGFSTKAKDKAVKVIRKVPGKGNVTIVVNVRDVLSGKTPGKDVSLLPNDTVIVEEKLVNF